MSIIQNNAGTLFFATYHTIDLFNNIINIAPTLYSDIINSTFAAELDYESL